MKNHIQSGSICKIIRSLANLDKFLRNRKKKANRRSIFDAQTRSLANLAAEAARHEYFTDIENEAILEQLSPLAPMLPYIPVFAEIHVSQLVSEAGSFEKLAEASSTSV